MTDDKKDGSNVTGGWPTWAAILKPRVPTRQLDLFDRFVGWMNKNAPDVWEGRPDLPLKSEAHHELRRKLGGTANSASAELSLMDWWDRLIAAGNQLERWEIPLLPPVVRLPPTRPEFVRRDFLLLQHFRTLEQAFFGRLQEPLAPIELRDAILCSAIINGGVVSRPMLGAIMSIDAKSIFGYDGELRVVLRLPVGKAEFLEQFWYPDALTSVLITRALKQRVISPSVDSKAGSNDRLLPERIYSALNALNLPRFDCGDLLRAAHTAFSLSAPPYIAAYLADELPSQSLASDTLRRLCGWRHEQETKTGDQEESGVMPSVGNYIVEANISYDPKSVRVDQVKIIRAVARILERKCKHPIQSIDDEIRQYGTGLWPVTRLLVEWTKWLLGGNSHEYHLFSRKRVEQSSARRYLRTIGRHLVTLAGDENLLEMEAEDLECLYELAAARVTQRTEHRYFWARVSSFHSFLMLAGAPPLDITELDGFEAAGFRRVSANLIGENDFQTFKQAIMSDDGWKSESPHERILIAAILGFRCGLRRRETQTLLLHDVHPEPDPYIVVRSSEFARLKSYSSHRRLPLRALVPDDELKLLLEHVARRKATLDDTLGLVFSYQGEPRTPLSDAELFAPITAAFQSIIRLTTPRFRFHHLRHSFANWLFLALLRIDNPKLVRNNPRLIQRSPFARERGAVLADTFFPRLLGTHQAPTRKNLYIVSGLLGHLSPRTTAQSYLHLIDWLAGRESDLVLGHRLENLGARQLAALCGLSPSMPHKAPYRELLSEPISFMRCFVSQQLPRENRESEDSGESVQKNPALAEIFAMLGESDPPPPATLIGILHRFFEGSDPGKLAHRYAVPRHAIVSAAGNYQRLYAKQSVARSKKAMRPPGAPRQNEAAKIFWSMLNGARSSYAIANPETRKNMIAASKLLIQRNGPKTARLYFGERQESALQVTLGLIAMGLPAKEMILEVRLADNSQRNARLIEDTAAKIEKLGVPLDYGSLDWPRRLPKGSLLRLHFLPRPLDESIRTKTLLTGQISAINYAALWILFASEVR